MHALPARRAFTLIELLIVVAIIAILAAIAIPNFLQAQTRSKVSRVKADIRTEVTALETYYVDYNHYPPDYGGDEWRSWAYLTTPISYVTSVLVDPFPMKNHPNVQHYDGGAPVPRAYLNPETLPDWKEDALAYNVRFGTVSPGPNGIYEWGELEPEFYWSHLVLPERIQDPAMIYDPTNGTVSLGDIFRTNQGTWGG